MNNRISQDNFGSQEGRHDGPQPIGEILADLLAQYQARFPEAQIVVVETAATAI